jgi:hypothetical protein
MSMAEFLIRIVSFLRHHNWREGLRRLRLVLSPACAIVLAVLGFKYMEDERIARTIAALLGISIGFLVPWLLVSGMIWAGDGFKTFQRGMRRVGIVLGLAGASVGFAVETRDVVLPDWSYWVESRRFQALLEEPTVSNAAATARRIDHSSVADRWKLCDSICPQWSEDDLQFIAPRRSLEHPTSGMDLEGRKEFYRRNQAEQEFEDDPSVCSCYQTSASDKGRLHWTATGIGRELRLDSFEPSPNADNVHVVHFDGAGAIWSIDFTTQPTVEEPLNAPNYLTDALYLYGGR